MTITKQIILAFLILNGIQCSAQIEYNVMPGEGPPKINLHQNYFSSEKLDSAFVQKNGIRSITVTETLFESDSLIYQKPTLVYGYHKNGSALHIESNSWSANGSGARRYRDEYGDSSVSVTHEHYIRSDSTVSDHRTIWTRYIINDTLSRTIVRRYYFDSLMSIIDKGIYDSKAVERSRRKNALIKRETNNNLEVVSVAEIRSRKYDLNSMCILPPREMRFENPKPTLLKDSLGRVIEVQSRAYTRIENKHYKAPFEILVLTYLDRTNILMGYRSYNQVNPIVFEKTTLETPQGEHPKFPLCYSESCLGDQFQATNFILGIPQNISIISGTRRKAYQTTITFW